MRLAHPRRPTASYVSHLPIVTAHPTYPVKVRLQEVHLLGILQQPRPVSLVQLLLLQHHLDGARRVVDLAGGRVDGGVQIELDVVVGLFRLAVARKGHALRLHVQLDLGGVDIRHRNRQEDVVLYRFRLARALRPGHWERGRGVSDVCGVVLVQLRPLRDAIFAGFLGRNVMRRTHLQA